MEAAIGSVMMTIALLKHQLAPRHSMFFDLATTITFSRLTLASIWLALIAGPGLLLLDSAALRIHSVTAPNGSPMTSQTRTLKSGTASINPQ